MKKPVKKVAILVSAAYLCLLCEACSLNSNSRWDTVYANYRAPHAGDGYAEIEPIKD